MARMRIKYELNPGGVGVRLDKLAKISEEFEKFLRSLAQDCGAPVSFGEWLARDFYNGSFGSLVEYVNNVELPTAVKFNAGIRFFSRFKNGHLPPVYSPTTIKQFIDIGDAIDADEKIKVGVFDDINATAREPVWEEITKIVIKNVDAVFHETYRYEGALQGRLGSWYKDSNYFNLRDLASSLLVKCYYPVAMYDKIHGLYDDKDAVINVSGSIVADRGTGQVREMRVTWAKSYVPLSGHEFNKLFGLAPDLTGDMTASEYLDRIRSDGKA
jgi:hypothetical protein